MAITVTGGDGSMNEQAFSLLIGLQAHMGYREGVWTGLVASEATGTRLVTVTLGTAVGPGALVQSTTDVTVTLDANAGSNPRTDYIVLEINWSGAGATGTVKFVKGTNAANPVAPALTKTEGSLWQIPLARVTVRPSVAQLLSSDIERCRPLARVSKEYSDVFGTGSVGFGNVDIQRCSIPVADPGWPYRLMVSAWMDPTASSQGRAKVEVKVNGVVTGTGYTVDKNAGPAVVASRSSDVLNGASTVTANVTPLSMVANLGIQSGRLNVTLLPA